MKDTVEYIGCQEKINITEGSVFKIKLEAVTGTGFQWILKEPTSFLKQLNPDLLEYSTNEESENMPGHVSHQILYFKAMKKGDGILSLEYKRTFEEGIEKSCIIEFEIN